MSLPKKISSIDNLLPQIKKTSGLASLNPITAITDTINNIASYSIASKSIDFEKIKANNQHKENLALVSARSEYEKAKIAENLECFHAEVKTTRKRMKKDHKYRMTHLNQRGQLIKAIIKEKDYEVKKSYIHFLSSKF